jgi:hypothetical protein
MNSKLRKKVHAIGEIQKEIGFTVTPKQNRTTLVVSDWYLMGHFHNCFRQLTLKHNNFCGIQDKNMFQFHSKHGNKSQPATSHHSESNGRMKNEVLHFKLHE